MFPLFTDSLLRPFQPELGVGAGSFYGAKDSSKARFYCQDTKKQYIAVQYISHHTTPHMWPVWLKGKDLGCSGAADFIAERPKNGFETQKIAHSLPYGWPTIRTNLDFEPPISNLKCLKITKNGHTFPIIRLHLLIFKGRQGLIVTCVKWYKSKTKWIFVECWAWEVRWLSTISGKRTHHGFK